MRTGVVRKHFKDKQLWAGPWRMAACGWEQGRPWGCCWDREWSGQTPQEQAGLRGAEREMQCTLTGHLCGIYPDNWTSPPVAPLTPQNPQEALLYFYKAVLLSCACAGRGDLRVGFGAWPGGCVRHHGVPLHFSVTLTLGAAPQLCLLLEGNRKGSCSKVTVLRWQYCLENSHSTYSWTDLPMIIFQDLFRN